MKAKFYFMAFMLMASVCAFAQWTKPAAPEGTTLTAGEQVYLYNVGADGFFLGANDWQTRASVDGVRGYKVWLEPHAEDAASYYITNYIEDGNPAGKTLCVYISTENGTENIWVDQDKTTDTDKLFTFEAQADGTYKIGLSALNTIYNPKDYPDTYLGLIPEKNDTRLYLCAPEVYNLPEFDPAGFMTTWKIIAPAEYTTYTTAKKTWIAAVKLAEEIEKAKAENTGIDLSEVEAVYANTASTEAQLEAASAQLVELVIAFQTAKASPETPADYTPYIVNPSYDKNNKEGWSGTEPAFQTFGNAEYYWTTYDINQTLTGLKNGVYRVGVTAFYRAGWADWDAEAYRKLVEENDNSSQNAKLYANTSAVTGLTANLPLLSQFASESSLTSEEITNAYGYIPNAMVSAAYYFDNGKVAPTSLLTIVNDGKLTIGLKDEVSVDGDWTIFDNWTLHYLGDSDEAYSYMKEDYLSNSVDYVGFIDETGAYYQKSVYDTYVAAQTVLINAQTPSDITAAIAAYDSAAKALKASLDAYATYYAKYEEAEVFLADRGDTFFGTGAEILSDYLGSEDAPSEQFPNGGALYILYEGLLTPEQILAEVKFLDKLMADAIATGMTDGTDCTELLKNPTFATSDGWTKQPGVTFPTNGNPVGEGPNMLFDISQNLTGLQNGLYEFTVNAAYLAADYSALTGEEDYKAYVYINGYKEKMNSVLSEPSETQAHSSDYYSEGVGYFPNSVDGAYAAFQAGRYKQTVYGLVTDGTMKVGLRNDLRYADGSRAWWTNASLIFRAKNAEILAEVIATTIPDAEALLANKAGQPEIDALSSAIATAKEATDGLYEVLVSLKAAEDAVVASTATYVNLATAIANLKTTIDEYSATASKEAKENAETLYAEASAAYEASTYSNDEAIAKIEEINLAAVAMKMPVIDDEQEIVDVSHLIVNNNFDPAKGDKNTGVIEGWTTSAMNGYKQNTVSYNRAAIDLYQDLVGLTPGKYTVTVHTYYRAGYYNAEWDRKEAGEETHLTTLYASTTDEKFETKVKNLYEDAQSTDYGVKVYTLANGLYAPDGTSPTVEFFNQGHYLNELEFVVGEDGKARIGLSKTEILANDYEVVGTWNLYYLGAAEPEPIDMTSLIVNPDFDPAKGDKNTGVIEGWTTSAMNGYKQNTVSYNRAAIDLYQDLVGLTAGKYKVTVHTYYRAGYYNEEWDRKEAGEETHLTTLYASTTDEKFETKVKNLYEDASETDYGVKVYTLANGLYAPDGTSPTVEFFKQGHYLNELEFVVGEDGKARIGLSKTEILANDYEVVGSWKLYYLGAVEEEKIDTVDMTSVIVNPTFDPAKGDKNTGVIEGWTTSAMNGYKQNTVSYNRAGITLYQDLVGLPKGNYEVTVHTYYRAGYYNEEWDRKEAGEETHLTTLYASTSDKKYETKVMNLYEDASETDYGVKVYTLANGLYAPDGTSPTVEFFNQGHYLNKLQFYVGEDGKARIGLEKTEILANDYEVVGAWNLYYLGDLGEDYIETAIEGVESATEAEVVSTTIYSLNGTVLSAPQKGINILRSVLSDGSVKVQKVLVR